MDSNYHINSASVTDRGLSEKRPQNEDSFLEIPDVGLFAVADGVGGAQAGEVASQMAMELLGEAFVNLQPGSDAEDVMKMAIERANEAIFQMSGDLEQLSMMATTIVALYLKDGVATIGHVGDSRLYRLDSRGSLYRETQDHSVVEEEVRAGRMTAAQAANHPSRNVISRALGAEPTVEVDLKTIMFEPGTVFLICSDGVTRHISDFEIRELLLSSPNPQLICDRVKAICYDRGAEDNLTAVIVRADEVAVDTESEQAQPTAFAEFEEETIAAARPEADTLELEGDEPVDSEPAGDSDEQYLIDDGFEEPEQIFAYEQYEETETVGESAPDTISIPASESPEYAQAAAADADMPFSMYAESEEKKKGGGSSLLTSFLMLLVGLAIGAGGFYAYQNYFAPVPEVPALTPKTNNIPQNSVDSLRHDAVTRPAEVIKQYEAAPPKDASDFYVLGRAYLTQKNFDEAKKALIEARNRLKDVTNAENKAALSMDINYGLVLAQSKEAQAALEKEMKLTETPAAESNSNTANTAREP